jgi:hypothetical protein
MERTNFVSYAISLDQEMYIDASGERIHPIHLAEILAKRETIPPAQPDLPKPTPRRPMHPNINYYFEDPVARPPTPSPGYATGFD